MSQTLIARTVLYLPAQFIAPLFSFLSLVIWTHLVSKSTIGIITIVASSQELFFVFLLGWWNNYVLRAAGAADKSGTGDRFSSTSTWVVAISVVLQALVCFLVVYTSVEGERHVSLYAAACLYVITRALNQYIAERARVRNLIGVYTLQTTAGPVIGFLVGLVGLALLGDDPALPLWGFGLAQAGAVVHAVIRYPSFFTTGPMDRRVLVAGLQYGGPLILSGVFGWVGLNASRFIVDEALGLEAVGLFAVAFGLGQRAAALAAAMVSAASFPLIVGLMDSGDRDAALRQMRANGALLFGVLAPSCAGLYVVGGDLVRLVLAHPFWDSTLDLLGPTLVAAFLFNFRTHFVAHIFMLDHKTRLLTLFTAIEAALVCVLGVILVRVDGLQGVVYAHLIAAAVVTLLMVDRAVRRLGLLFPVADVLKLALATTVMAGAVWSLGDGAGVVHLLLRCLLGMVVYAGCVAVLYARMLPTVLKGLGSLRPGLGKAGP